MYALSCVISPLPGSKKWTHHLGWIYIYKVMLFAGWEVRRSKAAFSSPRLLFFTIPADPKPVNHLFISSLIQITFVILDLFHVHAHRARVSVAVIRDRTTRTALRTNQIARFVTIPSVGPCVPLSNVFEGRGRCRQACEEWCGSRLCTDSNNFWMLCRVVLWTQMVEQKINSEV